MGVSYPDYLDWRAEQRAFVDLAARTSAGGVISWDRRTRTSFRPVRDCKLLFNVACSASDRSILRRRRRQTGRRARHGHQRRIMAATFQCRSGGDRPRDQFQWRELDGHRRSTGELRFLRSQQWEQRYASADRPTSEPTKLRRDRDSHPCRVIARLRPGVSERRGREWQ